MGADDSTPTGDNETHARAPAAARRLCWPRTRRVRATTCPLLVPILCAALASPVVGAATPDMAVALRAGTTGIGLDYDIALGRRFSARVGYSGFKYNYTLSGTNVNYDGTFKLSMVSGLVDWYAFNGGFHMTVGVVGNGTTVDLAGRPSAGGSYTLNGHVYSSGDVGSLTGRLKFGNSVSPYVGLGWGNPVGANRHLHVLLDVGAIYGGTPTVSLAAHCGPATPSGTPACAQLQSDAQIEAQKLQADTTIVKWYPVFDLGVAYRF